MSTRRVNLGKAAPELYQAVAKLEQLTTQRLEQAGIAKGFSHLLRLRASQLNRCAYCVRLHSRDALDCGESLDRLSLVAAWRECQYFSEKERACLSLVEAVTELASDQVPDAVYSEASAVLSDAEISAIEWLAVVINTWNRIAVTSRYPVEPE